MYDKNILNFDSSSVPEEYTAKNYDECDLLQIFRLLPENGKTYLLTTLRIRPGRTAPRPKITDNRIPACYASAR